MDRLACINVPGLALQVALRRFPDGHAAPLVLVKTDRPTSPILNLNRAARGHGLQAGMRYSEALSIVRELRAVTVSNDDLAQVHQEIFELLTKWSPDVERCPFDIGSFWLNSSGLSSLYGSEAAWGSAVRTALGRERYRAFVVVGLTRGGTYVLARSRRRSTVVLSAEAERRAMDEAPLALFPLADRPRRLLERLGVKTLGRLLTLPPHETARRFGPALAHELRRLAELDSLPLQAPLRPHPTVRLRKLDHAVVDRQAFLPLLVEPLHDGLTDLNRRGRLLSELRLVFVLESHGLISEVIRPAEPTTDDKKVLRLLSLRLDRIELPEGVIELRLLFAETARPPGTDELFAVRAERDLRRGAEAVAVLRARWGNDAVVRPVLTDSHIPEFSYRWEDVERLRPPRASRGPLTSVRRVAFERPPAANPSGERVGTVCRLHVLSSQGPVDREYWFLRRRRQVCWVSWDRTTARAALEGVVD